MMMDPLSRLFGGKEENKPKKANNDAALMQALLRQLPEG